MLRINVASFSHRPVGTQDGYVIDEPAEFSDVDFKINKNITAQVDLLKLPHEINVHVRNLKVAALLRCSRCLEEFECTLTVPSSQREFIIDLSPKEIGSEEDVFYVDTSRNEIDLTDMLREEILLHFPAVPVCSEHCKGLCPQCGRNLNHGNCSCPMERTEEVRNMPLRSLKH